MVCAVCMCKCVKRIVAVYTEVFRGDEDSSTCSKGNVASALSYCSCSNCRCRIVSCSCCNCYMICKAKLFCQIFLNTAYLLVALVNSS